MKGRAAKHLLWALAWLFLAGANFLFAALGPFVLFSLAAAVLSVVCASLDLAKFEESLNGGD